MVGVWMHLVLVAPGHHSAPLMAMVMVRASQRRSRRAFSSSRMVKVSFGLVFGLDVRLWLRWTRPSSDRAQRRVEAGHDAARFTAPRGFALVVGWASIQARISASGFRPSAEAANHSPRRKASIVDPTVEGCPSADDA